MEQPQVSVIIVPFPAQGHLNQLLQLSCLISSYGIPVYYVGSAVHNRQAKARVNGLNPLDIAKIRFHDIPTPPFASPPPDHNSPNKFPTQLQPAMYAMLNLRKPFSAYLNEMSEKFKRVIIIYDSMMAAVVQDVATVHNAESLIEAPYMDLLEKENNAEKNRKSWAIGPILPTKLSSASRHKCLDWLDKHEPKSVIYVSFGTTVSLSDEQINELAFGLEQSKVKFLWVLRDADKGDVFDGHVRRAELPTGFEKRVEGVGMVVRDWAPQPQILAHPSTGGYMSHCGWNSCIESITMGVPIAAWPMHSDQPRNTSLITDILKMGLVVREWKQRMEIVKASTVENVVRRLMASEEGDEIRKRAEELSATVRQATQEGGASRLELDSFIAHITR
ncbi:hypothetical protein DH2020_038870 [Rehmannia glutinosa]|uniref:Glycosyltransferase N-terminal domain-containing protein n=1 Tax=Rehmannia glutinosa TaxID=99300 RepID=A0ABR0UXE2_REHGL